MSLAAFLILELVDCGLNSNTIATSFRRTQFRFVQSDYAANSTFVISGVVSNADSTNKTVQILDSSSTVVASFVIPTGTAAHTRIDNLTTWAPSVDDGTYLIKLPATTNTGDIVIDALRIEITAPLGDAVPITIPMTSNEGVTGLDQSAGGGDITRTTSTTFVPIDSASTWHFKYTASEWATISSLRFSSVFTSAVTGGGLGGEVCLWDIDAGAAVSGVSVTNLTDPDTFPVYKDVDFSLSSLINGHTYEPRYRSTGLFLGFIPYNTYMHKVRLELHLSPFTKALIPFRPGKGQTATLSRLKLPTASKFTAGSIIAYFVETMGSTNPGQVNQGSYLADVGTVDQGGTFTNVTSSFCGPYTSTFNTGAPFRSGDISGDLIAGDRYGLNVTTVVNNQTQMLLYLQVLANAGGTFSSDTGGPTGSATDVTLMKSIEILKGSQLEADWYKRDLFGPNAAVSIPNIFTMEVPDVLKVALLPPPSESKTLDYIYTPMPTALSAPTTSINGGTVEIPDDFAPFIKYGVLADLFNKTGETHDPERGALCAQLFELGVQAARMQNNATDL